MHTPKKVFITGGTGVLGAKLVFDLFEKGHQLTLLIRNNASIQNLINTLNFYTNRSQKIIESIIWIYGDVLNEQILYDEIEAGMDVYHCAAMVSFNPKNTDKLKEVNIQGTANVVNACLNNKVNKLCHVSSIGALGSPVHGSRIDIDSPWLTTGKSPYSISKHNSEMEVWRGIAEGLNAVIVNPAVILGAGEWSSSSAALFSTVAKGMKFYTLGTTGYVYVNDVVSAMIRLTQSNISGERFIVSCETLSYKLLFNKIADALKVKAPAIKAGKFLTALAWRFEALRIKFTGGEPMVSKYTHKTAHSMSDYNGEPITQAIEFTYTPIDEAIKEIARLYTK